MSSQYKILCLSHDPGMVLGDGWHSGDNGRVDAITVALDPDSHYATMGHAGCDLVVGRYSTPMIEVGCLGGHDDIRQHHSEWTGASLLRLLWWAYQQPTDSDVWKAADHHDFRCWRPDRLRLLRNELDLPDVVLPAESGLPAVGEYTPCGDSTCTAAQHEVCELPAGHSGWHHNVGSGAQWWKKERP